MKKIIYTIILAVVFSFILSLNVNAGWVNGYFRSNGTYVQGYYRTEPNYYKWDNLSFDNDMNDIYNDKSFYRDFGYDPEPFDNDIPNYNYWNNWDTSSYDYIYDDYDYYFDYDWNY